MFSLPPSYLLFRAKQRVRRLGLAVIFGLLALHQTFASAKLASVEEALQGKADLWGEAAMAEPNGPSYEFFENLLPPPRYVNADFKFYPIVLSAPNAKIKARLISNGSGINLRGGSRSWNDTGTPIFFRIGPDEFRFGDILERVGHPTLAHGYLPIPEIRYAHGSEVYMLEAFAATLPELAANGVVLARFGLASGTNGLATVEIDARPLKFQEGKLLNENGEILALFDQNWTWERQRAHAKITTNKFATVAICTRPMSTDVLRAVDYDHQREVCVETWERVIQQGMKVSVPEPLVNNAWRNMVIQDFSLTFSNRICYSAGNQYEKMYAAESSDAALPLMSWGYETDMRRLLPVILDLVDKRLPHHFAGHKLNAVCQFYAQTRDLAFVKELLPRWKRELELILNDRTPEYGLLAKENYCTDIEVPVYSFTADAVCWAALRDIAPILDALGEDAPISGAHVRAEAAHFKKSILAAVEENARPEVTPPFIPMALFYGEDIHDPITETRLGSYWDLVANYVIGSRIFAGTERELWLPQYFEQHGGLLMGLTRSAAANHTFWTGKNRTNPLYGMRYNLDTLRRDNEERALVGFYGMLAHGMTRNTFIGAEGCSVEPLDAGGRFFYCPPNSAANGQWLATFRNLLIQDLDMNEDGVPDTLRLMFATPRRWLEDGKSILVERAPTAFGPISIRMESRLREGTVVTSVTMPSRNLPERTLLRARMPEGWKVVSARAGDKGLSLDASASADVSSLRGNVTIRFAVEKLQ